jgi:uncharacterized protein YjiS (DUF1127 family)
MRTGSFNQTNRSESWSPLIIKETLLDLTRYVNETLRRWPGPLPAPAFSGWPDWACRFRNVVRALTASAVSAHRARASRTQRLQHLGSLDDRLLLDIGVQPGDFGRAARLNRAPWFPNPWH